MKRDVSTGDLYSWNVARPKVAQCIYPEVAALIKITVDSESGIGSGHQ